MDSFENGTLLAGRYLFERELGRGGMGAVWAATDQKLRRRVAVKVMTEGMSDSEQAFPRFEREAMAVARLHGPHIVQVHDYGIDDGCPYIVMELLNGEDLKARLKRVRRLNLSDTAGIVVQIAKGLHAAHSERIVHRDLKPANVFLALEQGEEVAKVFDFGVAKAKIGEDTDATAEGVLLGTPRYMSPEQAYGAKLVDHRSDVWALGIIAYACVCGRLPFIAPGTGHVLVKICTEPHPKPSELIPYLGAEVDAFFDKALAKKPDERFQSAIELASAFAQLANMSAPSLDQAVAALPRPRASDPLAAVAEDLSGPHEPTRIEGSGSRSAHSLSASLLGDSIPHAPTSADTPGALKRDSSARSSASDLSSDGTLGPAMTSLDGGRTWLGSRGGRAGVALAALAIIGVVAMAMVGGDESTSESTERPAQAAAAAPETASEPATPPSSDTAGDAKRGEEAEAEEPSEAKSKQSADDATSKAPKRSTRRAKPGPKPKTKPEPEPAKEEAKTEPKPAPTKEEPKPKSKDGLDVFNKRW